VKAEPVRSKYQSYTAVVIQVIAPLHCVEYGINVVVLINRYDIFLRCQTQVG